MHVIYRSYGGENLKNRPSYYSKELALLSFTRAAEQVPEVKLTFLNDGPVPEQRLRLMRGRGDIVTLDSAGMRGSYMAALRLAARQAGPHDELVWFSEDDYLYRPDALRALDAAGALDADYFALYAATPGRPVGSADIDPYHEWTPRHWTPLGPLPAGGSDWYRTVSTTSTFGGRRGAIRQDMSIFVQGLIPYRNSLRDHDTCVVFQGYKPHRWRELADDLTLRRTGPLPHRAKQAALVPFKVAMNVRSHRRTSRRRVMVSPAPNLATHMETGWIAPGVDWQEIARDTWDWAGARGLVR